MAYDPGALQTALAAAVGDDPALLEELRSAFIDSAATHARALALARTEPSWQLAALKLQGLAASFGATDLMKRAGEAASAAPGDPVTLRRVAVAIAAFGG